jgi:hypothetical protein
VCVCKNFVYTRMWWGTHFWQRGLSIESNTFNHVATTRKALPWGIAHMMRSLSECSCVILRCAVEVSTITLPSSNLTQLLKMIIYSWFSYYNMVI